LKGLGYPADIFRYKPAKALEIIRVSGLIAKDNSPGKTDSASLPDRIYFRRDGEIPGHKNTDESGPPCSNRSRRVFALLWMKPR